MNFDTLFMNPKGRSSRAQFVPALITLVAVIAFYAFLVTGRTATWCLLVVVAPAVILHARRLHDMGYGAQLDAVVPVTALVVSAAFALWGCIGKGQADANRFGAPATA